ncbi:MAG: pentapeptide repeat-containing protein, partial [SAR324 cluster bacterium]|nr:pentapeptide repeat-containing protein [SAR324 cluster bacterium]
MAKAKGATGEMGATGANVIHGETMFTIRRATMALVGFGLFTAVTLGQPYRAILGSGGIKLPIASAEVTLAGFLIVGPLVLLAIWVYLQIHLQRLWKEPIATDKPHWHALGTYDRPFPLLMGWLMHTVLVQVLLFGFAFKATIFPWVNLLFLFAFGGGFAVALLAVSRRWPDPPLPGREEASQENDWPKPPWPARGWNSTDERRGTVRVWRRGSLLVELLLLPAIAFYGGPLLALDEIDMTKADLQKVSLRGLRLAGADFSYADLTNALLTGSDFSGANFKKAILLDAVMIGADLRGANLEDAVLASAVLESANLSNANMAGANLRSGNFLRANL